MTLKELLSSDVSSVFLNTDDFAETVVFYPRGSAPARSIVGVVTSDNSKMNQDREHKTVEMNELVMMFAKDSSTGISDINEKGVIEREDGSRWEWDQTADDDGNVIYVKFKRNVQVRYGMRGVVT